METPLFQITLRRLLLAIFWLGVCLAMLRYWWLSIDEFVYLVFATMAFCIATGALFRNSALGALAGFILVTSGLIVANLIAMIQLF